MLLEGFMTIINKYVLIVDWKETFITQEYWMFAKYLEKHGWELIKLSQLNIDKIKLQKSIVLCDTFDDFDMNRLKSQNTIILNKLDDVFPFNDIRNQCINACDAIIGTYQYLYKDSGHIYPALPIKPSLWSPHCAINEFFDDISFNTSPNDTRILMSGITNKAYPLRMFVLENQQFYPFIERLIHPCYDARKYNENTVMAKEYYKHVNKYMCAFCDASEFKYILIKVFEITAVGSLLLVQDSIKEQLRTLGFIDMENCIMCNKDNVYDIMEWILDKGNRVIVDIIRKKGMELTRSKHTLRHRVEAFVDWVDKTYT